MFIILLYIINYIVYYLFYCIMKKYNEKRYTAVKGKGDKC